MEITQCSLRIAPGSTLNCSRGIEDCGIVALSWTLGTHHYSIVNGQHYDERNEKYDT